MKNIPLRDCYVNQGEILKERAIVSGLMKKFDNCL
jgi:hypothetical protein